MGQTQRAAALHSQGTAGETPETVGNEDRTSQCLAGRVPRMGFYVEEEDSYLWCKKRAILKVFSAYIFKKKQ